ncbi:hypothetical protein V8G54_008762 [Vigna mungo]|uniref:ATP-dependent RNA helicase n=1 Tax=Vigna mungo TaxID=3915 RepID=A0AAQ3P4J8_VIGMU
MGLQGTRPKKKGTREEIMGVKKLNQGVKNEGIGSNDNVFASCSFSSLGLDSNLCEQLHERLGFEVPTLVQAQAIPVILSGRHALVNAATGTGKTAAYLAPIVHLLQGYENRIQRSDGTFGAPWLRVNFIEEGDGESESWNFTLVLVPTRELCLQVYEILQKLLHRFHWIVPGYIMGGENRSKEKARLRKGISILIATPGRLLDHLKNTTSFLHLNLRWIIFDEADRILELGFGKDIEEILDLLGSRKTAHDDQKNTVTRNSKIQRQNLLLSATLNEKVNHLAKISLDNPVMVGLDDKKIEQIATAVSNDHSESDEDNEDQYSSKMPTVGDYKVPVQLIQRYMKVPCGSRLPVLLSIIKHLFEREPSQKEDRRTSFQTFKTEKSALLLSSDVSARGLDFPKVRCIIQYDSPGEATEYVHRYLPIFTVGRTARLGEKGESLLFLQPVEIDYLQDLEKHGVSLTEYPILKVLDSFPLYGQKNYTKKSVFIDSHPWVLCLQKALEAFIMSKEGGCVWMLSVEIKGTFLNLPVKINPKIQGWEEAIDLRGEVANKVVDLTFPLSVDSHFLPRSYTSKYIKETIAPKFAEVDKLAKKAFCSWVRAYTAHRGELKRIFMIKKLHLGHVAKSFALKQQPSLVGQSFQKQAKKRKRFERKTGVSKKRKVGSVTERRR